MPFRRMADPAFRAAQRDGLYAPHVAALNRFIDELVATSGRGWMPHIAPMYGGVHARVLTMFRDPGPKTLETGGSGLLCIENDDPTAERYARLLAEVNLPVSELVPWNAYPWYINRRPTHAQLTAAAETLSRLLPLLPRLRVVLLHGGDAQRGWRIFRRRHPGQADAVTVIATYHTSPQAFWHADPAERERRRRKLHDDLREVVALLART